MQELNESVRHILAQNIRTLRKAQGLSQDELAHLTGMHRTYVGSVEREERNVTLSTLEAFAAALNVAVPELLTRKRGGVDAGTETKRENA